MEARNKPIRKFGRILVLNTGEIILDISYTASSIRQQFAKQFILVYRNIFASLDACKGSGLYKLPEMPVVLLERYVTTRGNMQLVIYYEDGRIERLFDPTVDELHFKLSKFNIAKETLDRLIEYILAY